MSRARPDLITPKGISASDRLKAQAKKLGRNPQPVLHRYALEGAIRRIFASDHADRFGLSTSLKGGALMFFAEGVDPIAGRGTTDIDIQLSGYQGTMEDLAGIMREVLAAVPPVDDGVRFGIDTVTVTSERGEGVPGGAIEAHVQVGEASFTFKVDVGFYAPELADTLVAVDYPSLLDLEPVRIWRQPIEFAISDKVHASYKHGGRNTRLRDCYDMFVFLTKCAVDDDRLAAAFARSWPMYGTALPGSIDEIDGLTDTWAAGHERTWQALQSKSGWAVEVPPLTDVVRLIRERVAPALVPCKTAFDTAA